MREGTKEQNDNVTNEYNNLKDIKCAKISVNGKIVKSPLYEVMCSL